MEHNEISEICRGIIGKKLKINEDKIPMYPWDNIIYLFASTNSNRNFSEQQIREKFQGEIQEKLKNIEMII